MRILAVDPGKLSGWVLWSSSDGVIGHGELQQQAMCEFIACEVPCLDLVVMESYHVTAQTLKKSRQYWSLEIIGAARFLCAVAGFVDFELQKPNEGKGFADNARLKREGLYFPTAGGHTNDAARHMCLALARHGLVIPKAE